MVQFDRKVLRQLQDNGVREINSYQIISKRLTIFRTNKGMFKSFKGDLYYLVAPRQKLWKNCRTGFISEDFENQQFFQ